MDLELDLTREFKDLGGQYGLYGPHLELGHATFGRKAAQSGLINLVGISKEGR